MAKFVGPEDGEEDDRVDDVLLPRKEVDQRLCSLDFTQDLNRKFLKYLRHGCIYMYNISDIIYDI